MVNDTILKLFAHSGEIDKKEKRKKEDIITFKHNILGSIRPFLELIQFFVLGARLSYGNPPKRWRVNQIPERSDFVSDRQPDACRFG